MSTSLKDLISQTPAVVRELDLANISPNPITNLKTPRTEDSEDFEVFTSSSAVTTPKFQNSEHDRSDTDKMRSEGSTPVFDSPTYENPRDKSYLPTITEPMSEPTKRAESTDVGSVSSGDAALSMRLEYQTVMLQNSKLEDSYQSENFENAALIERKNSLITQKSNLKIQIGDYKNDIAAIQAEISSLQIS